MRRAGRLAGARTGTVSVGAFTTNVQVKCTSYGNMHMYMHVYSTSITFIYTVLV